MLDAMKYYFAPLEGITGYIYRRAYHKFYPGVDRYYTPFIVPKEKKNLSSKERNDVLPKHNFGMCVIPQIMTNKPEDFLRIAAVLKNEYGYREVNLNLGCPSKTVVSKKRGAGFLTVPDRLDKFLDTVCGVLTSKGMKLSIKTRIGKDLPEEFPYLLEIFEKYPISELIVHPRVQRDFYGNVPNKQAFAHAYKASLENAWDLCYNGDLFTVQDCREIYREFPAISAVMMGRGLLQNPMLIDEIRIRENSGSSDKEFKDCCFRRFLDEEMEKGERRRRYELYLQLQDDYLRVLSGEKDVLFKMKELWMYMCQDFKDPMDYWRKMKKAQSLSEFQTYVTALCQNRQLLDTFHDTIGRADEWNT